MSGRWCVRRQRRPHRRLDAGGRSQVHQDVGSRMPDAGLTGRHPADLKVNGIALVASFERGRAQIIARNIQAVDRSPLVRLCEALCKSLPVDQGPHERAIRHVASVDSDRPVKARRQGRKSQGRPGSPQADEASEQERKGKSNSFHACVRVQSLLWANTIWLACRSQGFSWFCPPGGSTPA